MATNEAMLLTALANGTAIAGFQPQNNKQAYLAYLCGQELTLPTPRSVEEALLYNLCANGGMGGGSGDFEITHCDYLFDGARGKLYNELLAFVKKPTSAMYMFNETEGVDEITLEGVDFSKCKMFNCMFYYTKAKRVDVSSMDMSGMSSGGANYIFRACEAEEILGVGRNTNINYNFRDWLMDISTNLKRLTISPYAKGMNQPIDIENCSFTRETMVELFNSLPATCTSTITITGNPCVTDGTLTDDDKAIATNKGCTIIAE